MSQGTNDDDLVFVTDERPTEVWLARDADDYRAMHDLIVIEREGETTILEAGGWEEARPIALILALGGFTGSGDGAGKVETAPKDTAYVKVRGFTLADPSKVAEVEMTARRALAGKLGGFHPVVHQQAGFHRAAFAFEYIWNAAGCPPVRVRHPDLVNGPPALATGAGKIAPAAELNPTLAAVRVLEGLQPGREQEA